jgi:hypothetical protein
VLTFIGVKMLIVIGHIEIPIWISLLVVLGVLSASIIASILFPKVMVVATRVRLEGSTTPVFNLSGTGTLCHLSIFAIPESSDGNEEPMPEPQTLWEIEPIAGYDCGRPVEKIGEVMYGVVPAGYKQVRPEAGRTPDPLKRAEKYEYWFDTADAPHARNYFVIRGTHAVEVID